MKYQIHIFLKKLDKTMVYPELKGNALRKVLYAIGNYGKKDAKTVLCKSRLMDALEICPVACRQRLFYYYLNCEAKKAKWHGTVLCKYKNLSMPQIIRNIRSRIPAIHNGGWHFSNLGGIQKIKSKLINSLNDDRQDIKDMAKTIAYDDYLLECINQGKDIFGRIGESYEFSFIPPNEIGIKNLESIFPNFEKSIHYQREDLNEIKKL